MACMNNIIPELVHLFFQLMCLEEIGSVSHGSDAVMASQEISFTPGKITNVRYTTTSTCGVFIYVGVSCGVVITTSFRTWFGLLKL